MSKTHWLGVAVLFVASVATLNSRSSFGQQIVVGGVGATVKEDNDKDDDDDERKKRKKDKERNKQGNNGGSSSNAGSANKSGNSNSQLQAQPFIQGKGQKDRNMSDRGKNRDQDDDDDDDDNGTNKKLLGPNQPGFNGKPNQPVIVQGGAAAEPANKKLGHWQGNEWQGSHKVENWSKVFGHNKKPFSSEWYKEHPQAWKYDDHNHKSNVWVVATVPGVYSWLGWGNVPPQYQVGFNSGPRFDPSHYGEWYPLGVYSMMTGPDDVGTRVLQLAVDRHGHINGNYFDMITDSDHGVSGVIDRHTQRAEWTLNQNPNVRFRASVFRLLQPYGSVTVQLPGGEQRWQFVRLEN